jgi:ribosome-binding factor A
MAGYHAIRVAELIQVEIADLLLQQIKDPRVKMTIVLRVEVSPDLRHARVYISHTTETAQRTALEGLLYAAGFMRNQLGKRLKLRYIPQLDLKLDTSIAYGVRISHLLNTLVSTGTLKNQDSSDPHA